MNDPFDHLAGLGGLKGWLAEHLSLFQGDGPLTPRAIVLTGLPGTGKRSVARAIAAAIGQSLARFVPGQEPDPVDILLVENLDREHLSFVRRLADPDEPMPFVIALTESPWELPAGLFRADAIDAIWHLDLPNERERAFIWDLAAARLGIGAPLFDNTLLARVSHEYTPAEIHAAFVRAMRASRPHTPKERHLLEALTEMEPQVHARQADLLRLTHWTRYNANSARQA